MSSNRDLLSITAFFSALFHALVILGISFKLPDIAAIRNSDNTLDVVLVNRSNNEVPIEADTVSTNDNQGGGKDDKEAESPLPYTHQNVSQVESIKLTAEQHQRTTLAPDKLITGRESNVAVVNKRTEKTRLKAKQAATGKDILTTKSQRQLRKERLIAKLNQSMEDYQKRPRKEYLSPTTKKHEAAKYLDDWRKKVENVGNTNYPIQAKAKSLSGSLILTVEIKANGTISSISIEKPSEHKLLNDAAKRFVRDASPFAAFPDELARTKDIVVITRAFHFLRTNKLSSSDASSHR